MNNRKHVQYIFYGSLLLIFSVLMFTLYYFSLIQKDYGLRINLTGRQRMLSQQIFKEILLFNNNIISSDEIQRTMTVFSETQDALLYGGYAPANLEKHEFRKLPETSDSEIILKLTDVKNEWEPIKNKILVFLQTKDNKTLISIMSHNKSLITKIDNSVYALQLESERKTLINRIIILSFSTMISILLIINIINKVRDLKNAERRIEELETLLPICSSCKKIRTNNEKPMEPDSWTTIEHYLHKNKDMTFTHGICPDCMNKLYPGMLESIKKQV
ncbi:MAG: hypothetical protein CVV49_07675 [Spirochaetae bacterium HGW-Spirochaetae-5]|nr:MAG: hypothetical protein CVV49_07675 [Spirochaetae bacterium HGW-Spirochaetae-5]